MTLSEKPLPVWDRGLAKDRRQFFKVRWCAPVTARTLLSAHPPSLPRFVCRGLMTTQSLGPFLLVVIVMLWICLPIFWGSTILLEHYFYRLNIQVVDFDSAASGANALVGPPLVQSLLQINSASTPHLTYYNASPSDFPNGPSDVMESVGYSRAWGAVVIYPNATTAWRNAVETGDASYDPTGCVGIYFSGARL